MFLATGVLDCLLDSGRSNQSWHEVAEWLSLFFCCSFTVMNVMLGASQKHVHLKWFFLPTRNMTLSAKLIR